MLAGNLDLEHRLPLSTVLHGMVCIYIYIYPRGRRFTGNSCPKGVYIYEVGLGWGGVGMVTFLALAHMVGATQVMGWGGVGVRVGWG